MNQERTIDRKDMINLERRGWKRLNALLTNGNVKYEQNLILKRWTQKQVRTIMFWSLFYATLTTILTSSQSSNGS